jgi:hypothetical protein
MLKRHAMNMYGEVDVKLHIFLTSTLDGERKDSLHPLAKWLPVVEKRMFPLPGIDPW